MLDDSLLYRFLPTDPHLSERVPTWGLNKSVVDSVREQITKFSAKGYSWLMGREQEFRVNLSPRKPEDHYDEFIAGKRQQLIREWDHLTEGQPIDVREQQLEAIKKFSAQELMVLELHIKLRENLEPRFGKTFYDAQPGIFEVSTKPVNPLEDIKQFHLLHETLADLAKEYSFSIEYGKRDISFSLRDKEGKNLFDARQGRQDPRGCRVASSILKTLSDAVPVFVKPSVHKYQAGQVYTLGVLRDNRLRYRDTAGDGQAILEIRDNHNVKAGEHPALETLLILAGANYGLFRHDDEYFKQHVRQAKYDTKKMFDSNQDGMFFTMEVLNLAMAAPDGRLVFPDSSRLSRAINKYKEFLGGELGFDYRATSNKALRDFFEGLKLNQDKSALDMDSVNGTSFADISAVKTKFSKLSFGKEVNRLRDSKGHGLDLMDVTTGEQNYLGENPSQQFLSRMAKSEILGRILDSGLFAEIVSAYAGSYQMAPPPAIPNRGPEKKY